jgi:hypothetical protein
MSIRSLVSGSILVLSAATIGLSAETTLAPDLTRISDGQIWELVNATAKSIQEGDKSFVRLQAEGKEGSTGSQAGIALVKGVEFKQGTIELDLKGRNVRQQSFLGVTFHALDNKRLEAIYFRPFNFRADPPFRTRAVQYISWPENTWQKLREQKPGVFENAVQPVPDPDGWFHARIEVEAKQVRVFVNNAADPSLVVERLTDRATGGVGLWADILDGAFANLKITPK